MREQYQRTAEVCTATARNLAGSLNAESIRDLFIAVRKGELSPDDAVQRLQHLPFEDLGFAKVDHHRKLRIGMPEVIFGQGKTPAQTAQIFSRLAKHGGNVLATRADAIITHNLVHFDPARRKDIQAVTPRQFLATLRSKV